MQKIIAKWKTMDRFSKSVVIYCVLIIVLLIPAIIFVAYRSSDSYKQKQYEEEIKKTNIEGGVYLSSDPRQLPNLSSLNIFIKRGMSADAMQTIKAVIRAQYKDQNNKNPDNLIRRVTFDAKTAKHAIDRETGKNTYWINFYLNDQSDKKYLLKAEIKDIDAHPKVQIGENNKSLTTIFDPEK